MVKNILKGNFFKNSFLIILTLGIFYFLSRRIDFKSVIEIIRNANLNFIIIILLFYIPIYLLSIKRWQELLWSIGCKVSFKKARILVLGATPIAAITPSKSGNFIKAYFLRDEIPFIKGIGCVLTENFLDFIIIIFLSFLGLFFYFNKMILLVLISLLLLSILILIISYKIKIGKKFSSNLNNLLFTLKNLTNTPPNLLLIICYSFLIWFFSLAQFYYYFSALNIQVPFLFVFSNIPLTILISMIPITVAGMGTRDTAIIVLFSRYATSVELLGVGIIFTLFRYVLPSLIGVFYIKPMFKIGKNS